MGKYENYSIVGSGTSNPDILEWSKNFLAQNKWNPELDSDLKSSSYSYISKQSITFLFTGIAEAKIASEQLNQDSQNFYLLEETIRRLVVQHRIPSINLQIQEIVCLGDAKNCIALQLKWDTDELIAFRNNLINEFNRLAIPGFKNLIDSFPTFSINLPLAYKRMPPEMFVKFEHELKKLLNEEKNEEEKFILLDILEYVKKVH